MSSSLAGSAQEGVISSHEQVTVEQITSRSEQKQEAKFGTAELLSNRNFLWLWLGRMISAFGDNVTNLTLLILVNALTGSTAAIATMTVILAVPQVTIGLLGGVYADRWNRKRILLFSDFVRGVLVLGFIFVNSAERIWLLYILAFVQACVGTLDSPARGAILPQIVPSQGLLAANSLNQTGNLLAMVLGSMAAGILVGLTGSYWLAFTIDALTFFVSFALVLLLKVKPQEQRQNVEDQGFSANVASVLGDLGSGLALIGKTPVLWGSLIVTGVMMLGLGSVNVLFVPFMANDLHVPISWFGFVEFAQVLGMILSGSLAATVLKFKLGHVISTGALALGTAIALIALSTATWHIVVVLFVVGCFVTPLQAAVATLTQTSVSNDVLGRIGSAMNTIIGAANLLSMASAGLLGALLGIRNVFFIAGLICVLAGLLALRLFRTEAK
ncbi:MAG: MFS transporter [Caldilineaceae bacterium]